MSLSYLQARKFFLNEKCYCNINLPAYFTFELLLNELDKILTNKDFKDITDNSSELPEKFNDINYTIYYNKDGCYAWRPLQLLNPVIYVLLVHYITQPYVWRLIKKQFRKFSENKNILCMSLPIINQHFETQQAKQILSWWENVEQLSIIQSLDFSCVFVTDIANCYSTLRTDNIICALEDKDKKIQRKSETFVGGNIIFLLRQIMHGQTSGLPQGSVLMDFIAEIVLGCADVMLSKKIELASIEEYKIIRYRDDYRIFTIDSQTGSRIIKLLNETMIELGFRLNSAKTAASEDVIEASIKQDKLYCISYLRNLSNKKHCINNFQKQLLSIYNFSKKFPNSGSLQKLLTMYYKKLELKVNNQNAMPIICMALEIALNNPRTYPITAAIIGKALSYLSLETRDQIFLKIFNKIKRKPNTEYFEIWLQRVMCNTNCHIEYKSGICRYVNNEPDSFIWNINWARANIKKIFKNNLIIDNNVISKLDLKICNNEIDFFDYY